MATGEGLTPLLTRCEPKGMGERADPPRAWAACDRGGEQALAIWSPERQWTFSLDPASGGTDAIEATPNVDGLARCTEKECVVSAWIDLRKGLVFRTPPLVPVARNDGHRGSERTLVREAGGTRLYVLDFSGASLHPLGHLQPCSERLRSQLRGRVATLACPKTDPDTGDVELVWQEIIDLEARQRWHADDLLLLYITAHGQVVEHDWRDEGDTLTRIDLPAGQRRGRRLHERHDRGADQSVRTASIEGAARRRSA